jgi:hypothetical protein
VKSSRPPPIPQGVVKSRWTTRGIEVCFETPKGNISIFFTGPVQLRAFAAMMVATADEAEKEVA